MSADHNRYRLDWGNGWAPFWADGEVYGGSVATTLPCEVAPVRQAIGFRGAAPGQSCDRRGLPRVRVAARSRPA